MTKKSTREVLDDIFARMDRDAPRAVKNQFKGWGVEAAYLFMTDEGFRRRRLRALGIDPLADHASIAATLKGHIYGDFLARRNAPPWASHSLCTRWVLVGYRTAELRLARAKTRRRSLKIVKDRTDA